MYLHICFYVYVCTYIYLYIYICIYGEGVCVCPYIYMPTTHTLLQNLHSNPTLLYKPTYLHTNPAPPYTALHHPIHTPLQTYTHPYKHTLPTLLPYYYAERSHFATDASSYAAFIGELVKFEFDLRAFWRREGVSIPPTDCTMFIALNTLIITPKHMCTFHIYMHICACIYLYTWYVSVSLCVCALMCLCVYVCADVYEPQVQRTIQTLVRVGS